MAARNTYNTEAMNPKLSRRSVLLGASLLAALSPHELAALDQHAHAAADGGHKLQYLDAATAAEIEALAAQIIPTDETGPGAKEAGVIYFIDRALLIANEEQRAVYRDGLAAARNAKSVAEIEHTQFFEILRRHVIIGFLANPSWGGNRDKIGWKAIGFDDRGSFQPPFGYYDMPENMG